MPGIMPPQAGLDAPEVLALVASDALADTVPAAPAAAAAIGTSTTAARADHVHAHTPKSVYSTGGSQALVPSNIGAEAVANKGGANGYAGLDGAGRLPAAQHPITTYTPLDAVPAFGSPVTVPSNLASGRDVFGTMDLASTVGVGALITCEVETGVASGVYHQVVEGRLTNVGGARRNRVPYAFFVPPGRRYKFVAGAGIGVTEAVLTHSWKET